MRDFYVGRICVRVFRRPRSAPQRPYFCRRYCIAAFGAGPIGVMVMRTLSAKEWAEIHARQQRQVDEWAVEALLRTLPPAYVEGDEWKRGTP